MALKLPLNDKLSVYSKNFKDVLSKDYSVLYIPIKNDKQ